MSILLREDREGICTLTLNRPEQMNLLTTEMLSALQKEFQSLKSDKKVVVPAGSRLQGSVDFVQRKSVSDDGWLRLLFNRIQLPDGRGVGTLASVSLRHPEKHPVCL